MLTIAQRRSPPTGQHGPGTVLSRREEEGVLDRNLCFTTRISTLISGLPRASRIFRYSAPHEEGRKAYFRVRQKYIQGAWV